MSDRSLLTARVTAIVVEQHGCDADLVHQVVEETLFQLLRMVRADHVDLDYLGHLSRTEEVEQFLWTAPRFAAAEESSPQASLDLKEDAA
jgi:hypothetical protein